MAIIATITTSDHITHHTTVPIELESTPVNRRQGLSDHHRFYINHFRYPRQTSDSTKLISQSEIPTSKLRRTQPAKLFFCLKKPYSINIKVGVLLISFYHIYTLCAKHIPLLIYAPSTYMRTQPRYIYPARPAN